MKTAIFTTITVMTMGLSAGTNMVCKNGVCMIDVSHLPKTRELKKERNNKRNLFKVVKKQDENKVETIIFPHSKYVMSKSEIEEYYGQKIQLIIPNNKNSLDSKIRKKILLPTSEFFCGKEHKDIVYHKETDSFECA